MFKGWQAAVREALDTKDHVSKAVDPHDKSIASHAVQRNVDPNSSALTDAFKKLYGDAGMSGTKHAMDEMGGAAKLGSGMSGLVGGMDWSKWKPGNPAAAEKVAGKGLNELMRNAGVTVRGIEQTTLNRMGDVIAQGLEAGSTYQEISGNISTMLDNPARADIISITETNRAFNASAIDEYKASGMDGWEWLAYAGACDICGDEEGPHDFGDDYPPAHPSCRCAVVVQLPDGSEAELGGEEDEVTAEDIAALEESAPIEEAPVEEVSAETLDLANIPLNEANQLESFFTRDVITDLYPKRADGSIDWDADGRYQYDPVLSNLLDIQGFNALPTPVNETDYTRLINDFGWQVLNRGLAGETKEEVAGYVEQFVSSDQPFIGKGMFGNGTYFAQGSEVAIEFAKQDRNGIERVTGEVIEAALHPKAKVIDFKDLMKQIGYKSPNRQELMAQYSQLMEDNPSIVAAARGYDAIRIPNPTVNITHTGPVEDVYWIILNRGALVVKHG
jgi:Phage Mu protein F like protein